MKVYVFKIKNGKLRKVSYTETDNSSVDEMSLRAIEIEKFFSDKGEIILEKFSMLYNKLFKRRLNYGN